MNRTEKHILEVLQPFSDEQTVHIKTIKVSYEKSSAELPTMDMDLYSDNTIVPSINITMNPFQEEATETQELSTQLSLTVQVDERYQEVKLLGEGGMGSVFSVFDTVLKRNLALKRISSEIMGRPDS